MSKKPISTWILMTIVALAWCGVSPLLPAAQASAEYAFVVDESASSATVTLTAMGLSDSDSSKVAGVIVATLTPSCGEFTEIHITEAHLDLPDNPSLHLDGGFLGGVYINSSNLGLYLGDGYGAPGLPAVVDGAGNFAQLGNLVQGVGVLSYQGYGLAGGSIGTGSFNLAGEPPYSVDFLGNVTDDGTNVTLVVPLNFSESVEFSGVPVTITVAGTLLARAPTSCVTGACCVGSACTVDTQEACVALGGEYLGNDTTCDPNPCAPPLCAGDMNCDGVVNYGDIDIFVAALSCIGGDPGCWPPAGVPADCPWLNGDCDGDGNVTYADIDPFVGRIGATCE